jgi:uracil-DNA glycosylase
VSRRPRRADEYLCTLLRPAQRKVQLSARCSSPSIPDASSAHRTSARTACGSPATTTATRTKRVTGTLVDVPTDVLASLLREIRACRICEETLPLGPRPVLNVGATARVLIAGHAPGSKVHESEVPWDDKSGELLRTWLGVDDSVFYDGDRIALVPMGFCYPGRGKGGDLPPRPECRATWHHRLLPLLGETRLTIAIGEHAQRYHLGDRWLGSVTANLRCFDQFDTVLPIPHPSPRNRPWLAKNPFFERDTVPYLRRRVAEALA